MKRNRRGLVLRVSIFIGLIVLMGMREFENNLAKNGQDNFATQGIALGSKIGGEEIKKWSEEVGERVRKELESADLSLSKYSGIIIKIGADEVRKIEWKKIWEKYGIPLVKQYVIDTLVSAGDPHRNMRAPVYNQLKILKPGLSLEGEFLARRQPKVQKALEQLTGQTIESDKVPRIACAFSGGGYRAMVLTAGFMKGLSDLKILDSITYISSLSGSTWYIGPWTLMQRPSSNFAISVDQYNDKLRDKIRSNRFNLISKGNQASINLTRVASDAIFPKVAFEQIVSSVDFYGSLLAHALLSEFEDLEQRQRLSNQWFSVQLGNMPWPIYTAISMAKDDEDKYNYHWYEFTPEEIRDLEVGFAFPSFAFGRTFERGESTNFAPEQSFGFLLGMWGSAYTVNLKDIKRIFEAQEGTTLAEDAKLLKSLEYENQVAFFRDLITNATDFNALKLVLTKKIIENLSDSRIGSVRAAPAQVNNPFREYQHASSWLQNRERITFVDAGIDYNIPLRPLFRPDRKIDLILVGDASSNAGSSEEIKKALADIERFYQINYIRDKEMSDSTMIVYRPAEQTKGPLIVYMQFFLDQQLLKQSMQDSSLRLLVERDKLNAFDAQRCIDSNYCATLNFSYSLDDFNQLAGVSEFIVKAHQAKLKQIIQETVKTEEFEFGGDGF